MMNTVHCTLVENPASGPVIPGGGGVRKIRVARQGTGKSGGIRVIYYWIAADHQIYMLLAYSKSKRDNLTPEELQIVRDLVKEL